MALDECIDLEAYLAGNLLAEKSVVNQLLHLLAVVLTDTVHGVAA